MRTHYEILGVPRDATPAEIRAAYLRLVQLHHPDRNSAPSAGSKTAEINEAYSVLADSEKRAVYDQSLSSPREASQQSGHSKTNNPKPLNQIICELCGVQDASLRISLVYWVFSLILVTKRDGKGGIWCEKCRAKQATQFSLLSGIIGWWGIPWGPIYTLHALYFNALGGKQNRSDNAILLRILGFQLFEKGKSKEALNALDASINLERDQATIQFADSLRVMAGTYTKHSFPLFKFLTAVPSIAMIGLICLGAYTISSQPSGYAEKYVGKSGRPFANTPSASSARDKVNDLANELAEAVHANATPTGSRREGNTTIYEYQLDRSKYRPEMFGAISTQIAPHLDDSKANADGFATSAYINAEIMGLSIAILNGFDNGQDVSNEIDKVKSLGENKMCREWLATNGYDSPYSSLLIALDDISNNQDGVSVAKRNANLNEFEAKLRSTEGQIKIARTIRDFNSEDTWVQEHNLYVTLYNRLLAKARLHRNIYSKVDLAFNKCLDPKS